jgi:hypothetical protein
MKTKQTIIEKKYSESIQELNELCREIAQKYNLYDWYGKPRNSFILDTLMNYSCTDCISKLFSNPRRNSDVDSIYSENHKLAVDLLMDQLQYRMESEGLGFQTGVEVQNEYGRADIVIQATFTGIQVDFKGLKFIIEVKTGKGLSYSQLFRYLIGEPKTVMVIVWRVIMGQTFAIVREEVNDLIIVYSNTILRRGNRVLREDAHECGHSPFTNNNYVIKDPQKVINEFKDALVVNLPKAVGSILQILKENGFDGIKVDSFGNIKQ